LIFRSQFWSDFVLDWNHGMLKVNIQEAKTHLSRYIDRVEQGDVVVVCRHNQPVAELRAIEAPLARSVRVAGLLKGQIHWEPDAFAPMTVEELAEFDGVPVVPHVDPA
jgi:antitoxin (DNA-binding transcriptional repressor) of toxin-antitoxin stability system